MAKRTTKRQSKKEYTLTEFKAWLEGIEEMQPTNWAPDQNQWATIREKLMNIVEEVVEVEAPSAPNVPMPAGPIPRAQPSQMPPAGMQPPPGPPPNIPMTSALDSANVEMTPAAAAALKGNLPTNMVPGPDGKLKTPDMDTTDGNFNSTFE